MKRRVAGLMVDIERNGPGPTFDLIVVKTCHCNPAAREIDVIGVTRIYVPREKKLAQTESRTAALLAAGSPAWANGIAVAGFVIASGDVPVLPFGHSQKSGVAATGTGYRFWWKKSSLFSAQIVSMIGCFALNQYSFMVMGAL